MAPDEKTRLVRAVESRMRMCDGLRDHCRRCLDTRRWGGSVALMLVDAGFMSIGVNYFTLVVPAVARYASRMESGAAPQWLANLATVDYNDVADIWKNRRSWHVVQGVAALLAEDGVDDRVALRKWAARARVEGWENDPVGSVSGVGINTYQYLRMMGGVDTSMPDKIVRRVTVEILDDAAVSLPTKSDDDLIKTIDVLAGETGYRPIELCWMTWMVQSEGQKVRMDKYRDLLHRI